jgi:hypothetical protein
VSHDHTALEVTALDVTAVGVGLAVSSIGRPQLAELLQSAASSTVPPVAVAIADQSQAGLRLPPQPTPFPVEVVGSGGGASAGRNDAVRALAGRAAVLAFPNDDSLLPPATVAAVARCFAERPDVVAVAGALVEGGTARFEQPPQGSALDPVTIWRAIEPAMFVRTSAFEAVGGFRTDLGTGSPGPWQSGEGTDLLLRLMRAGGTVLSRPDIEMTGRGERRDLTPTALVAKHRGYARGTGFVYRAHPYSTYRRWRTVAGPWLRPTAHAPERVLSLRIAVARSVGRVEGLLGRTLPGGGPTRWL